MGSVVFQWKKVPQYQLLVVHNRDNSHSRVFKPACWWAKNEDTKHIFGGREEKDGGTFFGCSKQGRVAFLVNGSLFSKETSELLPVRFLKGKMTPIEFAKELYMNKNLSLDCSFHLIVADIPSNSMVCISKKHKYMEDVEIKEVGPGFYDIYANYIPDFTNPKSLYLKNNLREIVAEYINKGLTMKKIADELMNDESLDPSTLKWQKLAKESSLETTESYGTTCITAFGVNTTGKVSFYEKYLENGEWHEREHDIENGVATSTSTSTISS